MKTPKEKSTWHQKHQNQCVLFFSRNRFNFAPGIVCCFFFFFHLCHSALAKVALRVREGNASLSESIDEDNLCKSAHILGAMCVFNSVRVKQSTPVPAMSLWNDRINAMSNWWWSTHFFILSTSLQLTDRWRNDCCKSRPADWLNGESPGDVCYKLTWAMPTCDRRLPTTANLLVVVMVW